MMCSAMMTRQPKSSAGGSTIGASHVGPKWLRYALRRRLAPGRSSGHDGACAHQRDLWTDDTGRRSAHRTPHRIRAHSRLRLSLRLVRYALCGAAGIYRDEGALRTPPQIITRVNELVEILRYLFRYRAAIRRCNIGTCHRARSPPPSSLCTGDARQRVASMV